MGPLFVIAAAGTAAALATVARAFWRERSPGVAVLLYHRVRTPEAYAELVGAERNFSVKTDEFEAQLDSLRADGATFLDLAALRDVLAGRRPVPHRAVAITFDDGSLSVLTEAAPRLLARQIPATVFVTTDPSAWVFDEQRRMTTAELLALRAYGFSLGAHGHSHHGLNEFDDASLAKELTESRTSLEATLGEVVDTMAVPLNFYDGRVLRAAASAGFRLVFTANPGRVRPGDRLTELRRIAVEGGMTLDVFRLSLEPGALALRRIVNLMKRVPPTLLGERRWMPLRARLFKSPLGPYLTARRLGRALILGSVVWAGALVVLALSPV
jgi:peptidoglycan/xylan/chitin deacetylase (PgdA/CDA1 family)